MKWGIVSTGNVAHDFCAGLCFHKKRIVSVVSRKLDNAQDFATRFGIENATDSIDDFLNSDIDVIYVASPHPYHFEFAKKAIIGGKNLLIEKPMTCSFERTQELIDLAEEHNTFLAEGYWTFCFPAFQKAKDLVDSGVIGDVINYSCDFWFKADRDDPNHRNWTQLGGGSILDIGVYPIAAVLRLEGSEQMPEVMSTMYIDSQYQVDTRGSCLLKFPESTASLSWGFDADSKEMTTIMGTLGNITIENPSHCPTSVTLSLRQERGKFSHETFNFELPQFTDHVLNYPNSEGFAYEAFAVENALGQGLKECPEMPLHVTSRVAQIVDTVFEQNNHTSLNGPK